MTIIEQILLKLGIDQSQVGPGLNDFKRRVGEATHEGAKGFVHVESAGKPFHKLMHRISEESPLVGLGLRLALNPIVGIIGAATLAFTQFRETQREAAEEAKRQAETQ